MNPRPLTEDEGGWAGSAVTAGLQGEAQTPVTLDRPGPVS